MAKTKKQDISYSLLPFANEKVKLVFLLVLSFVLYSNTLHHKYALDDEIVITRNAFVQKGFAGIKDILSTDSFTGYLGTDNVLAGGRYRPLSLVTFAIEQGLFPGATGISHFINVLLYVLLIFVLYRFLSNYVFKNFKDLAWVACLLFAIHPLHTEVVANIKSRDEILSLLFLTLTLLYAFRYFATENGPKKNLLIACVCFALALFSKETGLTFIVLLPLSAYFFTGRGLGAAIRTTLPFIAIGIGFFCLRGAISGFSLQQSKELMNNPYLLATPLQKYATIVFVLGYYLRLLFFPHPLLYEYTYNQIPYKDFSDLSVLLSLAVYIFLFYIAIRKFREKSLIAYGIFFYLVSIFIVSNIVVDIGAPMGERLLFQPSLGFVIVIAALIGSYVKAKKKPQLVWASLFIIGAAYLAKSWNRNKVWEDNFTLYAADIIEGANCAKINHNLGAQYMQFVDAEQDPQKRNEYLRKVIQYETRATEIHPKFTKPLVNVGVAYMKMNDMVNAIEWLKRDVANDSNSVEALVNLSSALINQNKTDESEKYLQMALRANPRYPEALGMMGLVQFNKKNYRLAVEYYMKALEINPRLTFVLQNLSYAYNVMGDMEKARYYKQKLDEVNAGR